MASHSSTLAWRIPWMEEPGRLQSMGSLRDTTERLHFHFSLSCFGEGNGNPLQCSCLENPRGGGAWWAAVYGVTQSRTRLKRLSSTILQTFFPCAFPKTQNKCLLCLNLKCITLFVCHWAKISNTLSTLKRLKKSKINKINIKKNTNIIWNEKGDITI